MPNIGDITIDLILKVNQFDKNASTVTTKLHGIDSAAQKSTSGIGKFSASLQSGAGSILKYVGGLGLITLGVGAVTRVLGESVKAYFASEDANKKLLASLDGNVKKLKELEVQADRLQQITIFDDETIKESQTFLAMQNRTQEEIKKTISAAVDYASVTGKTLPEAVKELSGTYEGVTGRLGKMDSRIKDLSLSELQNGAAVDIIGEKYKGFGEVVGNTTEGKIKRFNNALDELKEGIGEGFVTQLADQFNDVSQSADVSNETMKKSGKVLGEIVAWIAKGAVTGLLLRKAFEEIKIGADLSFVALKNIARAFLDLGASASNWISKIPVIGDAWQKMKDAAEPYLNKLYEILGAQNSLTGGGAVNENKYNKDGKYIGDTQRRRNSETANTGSKSSDKLGSKEHTEQIKKENNALEQYREDLQKLKDEQSAIVELIKSENIAAFEKLALMLKIYDLQKKINELQFIGINNIPESKTSADINDIFTIRGRGRTEGGGSEGEGKGVMFDREAQLKQWTEGIQFATTIFNILNKKPDTLFGSFLQILSIATQVAMLVGGEGIGGEGIGGLFGAVTGIFGAIGGLFGFEEGGYTGRGGKKQAAGIVHKDEYVVPSHMKSIFPLLEMIRSSKSSGSVSSGGGYMNGGFVNSVMSGGGSVYFNQEEGVSELVATRIVTKGTPGFKIKQNKKGLR